MKKYVLPFAVIAVHIIVIFVVIPLNINIGKAGNSSFNWETVISVAVAVLVCMDVWLIRGKHVSEGTMLFGQIFLCLLTMFLTLTILGTLFPHSVRYETNASMYIVTAIVAIIFLPFIYITLFKSDKDGEIVAICIAPKAGEPMQRVKTATLQKGGGIVGDRYQLQIGAYSKSKRVTIRQLTFIEEEAIKAANAEFGTDFTHEDTRRCILTRGIDLNNLVGKVFKIGDVRVLGIELCDPCDRPSKLCGKPGFKEAFENRGGLRVEVLDDGDIEEGSPIVL